MPSKNKTDLGLNQWDGTDKPKRLDFNTDNKLIQDKFDALDTTDKEIKDSLVGMKTSAEGAEIFNSYPGSDHPNVAQGEYSHAEGVANQAAGTAAHVEGRSNTASGDGAHAEGMGTAADGTAAHAQGADTLASGDYSHAGGIGTVASEEAQMAIGKYNTVESDAAFVIGGGELGEDGQGELEPVPKTIFKVGWDGKAYSDGSRLVMEPELNTAKGDIADNKAAIGRNTGDISNLKTTVTNHGTRINQLEEQGSGGDVPLPSSAVPQMDGTGAAGGSTQYARGDHRHPTDTTLALKSAIPTASGAAPLMDGTAAAGSSAQFARGDHRHPVDTSRAAANAIPAASGAAPLMDGTAAAGSSGQYARGDHRHPVDTSRAAASAIPAASGATPLMDGTAAVGSSTQYARGDHRHPVDTNRAPNYHASTGTGYGPGTASNFGHVKVSDNYTSSAGTAAGGVAASSQAVYNAYANCIKINGNQTIKGDLELTSLSPRDSCKLKIGEASFSETTTARGAIISYGSSHFLFTQGSFSPRNGGLSLGSPMNGVAYPGGGERRWSTVMR